MSDDTIAAAKKALDRASFLSTLKDGWHDGGGKRVSEKNMACLISLIEDYPILFLNTHIFPTDEGGISIEHSTAPLGFCMDVKGGKVSCETWDNYDGMPVPSPADIVRYMFEKAEIATHENMHAHLHYDGPLVIQVDSALGRLFGMALPEDEANGEDRYVFSRFTAQTKAALELGSMCLRTAMLEKSTINLFGAAFSGAETSRILQHAPEEWMLPEQGLILKKLIEEPGFALS